MAWAIVLFPAMAVAEFMGVQKLARACMERPFNLLTMLSFGAMLVVIVIATYTGLFLGPLVELV